MKTFFVFFGGGTNYHEPLARRSQFATNGHKYLMKIIMKNKINENSWQINDNSCPK